MNYIYIITNTTNGKVYVGRTTNPRRRAGGHFKDLRAGIHCNKPLQADFNTTGGEHFEFKVIEVCPDLLQCKLAETAWIAGFPETYNKFKRPYIKERVLTEFALDQYANFCVTFGAAPGCKGPVPLNWPARKPPVGGKPFRKKLSDEQVRELYALRGQITAREAHKRFNVSRALVTEIWAGRRRAKCL